MIFADALGIFDASEIASATICNMDTNTYKNLSTEEINEFYETASAVTVWRKINPTPFRGTCVNFTTVDGTNISYYFESGVQIGTYGVDNYVCYMPAKEYAAELSYLETEFLDAEDKYGGTLWNVSTAWDFLKLPQDPWAIPEIQVAAARSLVPYEFTDKYNDNITREQFAVLLENTIVVAGNYANMNAYMNEAGISYTPGRFSDCAGRNEAIDRLCAVGVISGRSDTEFAPDGAVSRQEAAAMITRVADLFMYVGTNYTIESTDADSVDEWARFYVNWVADKGIMFGDDQNRFDPHGSLTVQQAIASINRLYNLITYWES